MPVVVVRHGETDWSQTRRHTGRTDVALNAAGRSRATALAGALADLLEGVPPDRVLTSPLSRARDTCALAGFAARAVVDDRLMEWDYGQAEGRTTDDMRRRQPNWSVWTHPIEGGESLDQVAETSCSTRAA